MEEALHQEVAVEVEGPHLEVVEVAEVDHHLEAEEVEVGLHQERVEVAAHPLQNQESP